MKLETEVTALKGVGPVVAKKLAVLGIYTLKDLIHNFPRRYDDYSEVLPTSALRPGPVTIKARVKQVTGRYVRRGMHITEAVVSDDAGSVRIVWFNQPYRLTGLLKECEYYFSGTYQLSRQHFSIMNPSAELVSEFPLNTARIVPIYRETKGFNSRQMRAIINQVPELIQAQQELLPDWIIHEQQLMSYAEALNAMHFPTTPLQLNDAIRRLGFNEVFALSLAGLLNRATHRQEAGIAITFNEQKAKQFVASLPFSLTDDQRRVCWQILVDMAASEPMNRLLEGDVGSGKTVVATMAGLMAVVNGWQVALMAPTELLARQHAETIANLLASQGYDTAVGLLVGSLTAKQKEATRRAVESGDCKFIVGTHALIADKVNMQKLALVIIDEQHRFGVGQRKQLQQKAGRMPHVLSLTATPIPRSLALTLYGELSISRLVTKPHGRLPIETHLVSPNSKAQLFSAVIDTLKAGQQVYYVCPAISAESDSGVAAEVMYDQLRHKELKDYRIGLLHGKLSAGDKQSIMKRFLDHEIDVLVATTVIEVGVDVPNATTIVIENAERFGLAQLHQLRGRVGRNDLQGHCFLVLSDSKPPSRRLRALESSQDGFRLAELDLDIRGPGAIYGALQHGQLDLRIAKLSDRSLVAAARKSATEFIARQEDLLQYKELARQVSAMRAVTNLN